MIEVNKLKYKGDILNSEGTILGFYMLQDKIVLGSYLTDKKGIVYYSTTKERLLDYLQSDITLKELYLGSDDFIVYRKFRNDSVAYLKKEFVDILQCSDKYYNELSEGLKNPNINDLMNGS